MNSLNIIGRLAKEPEVRVTANQNQFCLFRIAVDNGKGKDPYFFPVVAWGNTAVNINKYFRKGDKIAINGMLTSREYQTENGEKRTTIEILVNAFDFCESKKTEQPQAAEQVPQQAAQIPDEGGTLPFEI